LTYRRSLTPSPSPQAGGDAAFKQRRADARREVSERVILGRDVGAEGGPLLGWALNISRGGVRAILEQKVALGEESDVTVGEESQLKRRGRIVWLQEEPDGLIVGIEFLGGTGQTLPPPPPNDE